MAGLITLLSCSLALYVCWLMLQPFFNVLLWAVVLSVVFYPMHRRIRERTGSARRWRRPLDAARRPADPAAGHLLTIAVVRELSGAAAATCRAASSG